VLYSAMPLELMEFNHWCAQSPRSQLRIDADRFPLALQIALLEDAARFPLLTDSPNHQEGADPRLWALQLLGDVRGNDTRIEEVLRKSEGSSRPEIVLDAQVALLKHGWPPTSDELILAELDRSNAGLLIELVKAHRLHSFLRLKETSAQGLLTYLQTSATEGGFVDRVLSEYLLGSAPEGTTHADLHAFVLDLELSGPQIFAALRKP
jgi:hypothetical protein